MNIFRETYIYFLPFLNIEVLWKPFLMEDRNMFIPAYIINAFAADHLATPGGRALATMALTYSTRIFHSRHTKIEIHEFLKVVFNFIEICVPLIFP